jgi:hypothetical protein
VIAARVERPGAAERIIEIRRVGAIDHVIGRAARGRGIHRVDRVGEPMALLLPALSIVRPLVGRNARAIEAAFCRACNARGGRAAPGRQAG